MSGKPNDLVVLDVFATEVQARILADQLEAEGIFTMVEAPSATALGFLNVSVPFGGAQIYVRSVDTERAKRLLAEFRATEGMIEDGAEGEGAKE